MCSIAPSAHRAHPLPPGPGPACAPRSAPETPGRAPAAGVGSTGRREVPLRAAPALRGHPPGPASAAPSEPAAPPPPAPAARPGAPKAAPLTEGAPGPQTPLARTSAAGSPAAAERPRAPALTGGKPSGRTRGVLESQPPERTRLLVSLTGQQIPPRTRASPAPPALRRAQRCQPRGARPLPGTSGGAVAPAAALPLAGTAAGEAGPGAAPPPSLTHWRGARAERARARVCARGCGTAAPLSPPCRPVSACAGVSSDQAWRRWPKAQPPEGAGGARVGRRGAAASLRPPALRGCGGLTAICKELSSFTGSFVKTWACAGRHRRSRLSAAAGSSGRLWAGPSCQRLCGPGRERLSEAAISTGTLVIDRKHLKCSQAT